MKREAKYISLSQSTIKEIVSVLSKVDKIPVEITDRESLNTKRKARILIKKLNKKLFLLKL